MLDPHLQQSIDHWLTWIEKEKHYSNHTSIAYKSDLLAFLHFLQNHFGASPTLNLLRDLKVTDFRAYISYKKREGLDAASRARALSCLRNFYSFIAKNYGIENVYIKVIKAPKLPIHLPKALSFDEIMAVIENMDISSIEPWVVKRDQAVITLLYGCGLRISEALNLTYKDFIGKTELIIKGKGGKTRVVPLLPQITASIEAYLKSCPHPHESSTPLFLGVKGAQLQPALIQRTLKEIRLAFGLPEATTPHAMRHSFATHLLSTGANLRVIQDLLGHASLSTTQKYTSVDHTQLLNTFNKAHPRS